MFVGEFGPPVSGVVPGPVGGVAHDLAVARVVDGRGGGYDQAESPWEWLVGGTCQ